MRETTAAKIAETRIAAANGEARELRISRKLSLADVAASCDVALTTVWRWETGKRTPRGAAALRYGHILDLLRGMHA